ncbi:maltose ABC transporter substrate-binding protein [Mahella sp.]|uniref:sugar ABC transporter substrate-binding protein n=1 Tax=Mahella sp. TaxID=2798721 RepID=UPI0025BECA94|nr:maltose ABC transporter substrate-binding protein [Mahella sp.]MBZ4665957.1 extracellular solute-binding protein family 1 [Mahella sp.]
MKRFLVALLAVVLAVSLVACGGSNQSQQGNEGSQEGGQETQPTEKQSVEITVWSHLTDQEIEEVQKVADKWSAETGNKAKILADTSDFQAFATAANSGKGPDIMFGLPHDNLGTFYKAGLLDPIPDDLINDSDYVPLSIQAVSFDGKKYAVPLAMESYALFYNTDMIKDPPKTWDEFINAAQQYGFMYDINNFYYSYAFVSGYGGYVFKNNNGAYDINDIGLNNDGAKKGFATISDLVNKYKFMPADIKGDIAKGNFQNKKIGMYISGPWDVPSFEDAGVNFAVTSLPKLENGNDMKPFVGVQAAFVNANSKNKDVAWDLMKYLIKNTPIPLFEIGNRIPVVNSVLNSDEVQSNEIMKGFADSASKGEPMPNIPEVQAMWTPANNNLTLLTSGKLAPDKVADQIVAQMKEGIATMQ